MASTPIAAPPRLQVPAATSDRSSIIDFVCLGERLVIEMDGGHHAGSPSDATRDAGLQSEGYRVLRYSNLEVLTQLDSVLEAILLALDS